jgi:hypothetical protein
MKRIFISISFLLIAFSLPGQKQDLQKLSSRKMKSLDSAGWEKTGFFIFNVNQAALSDWTSGGERFLIGINGVLNYASSKWAVFQRHLHRY